MRRDPLLLAVSALGIGQITAWGTSYYCLGVLAGPIAAETGWSRSFLYLGFTVSLLVMGLASGWAGRAIDRYGPRVIMSAGVVVVSLGLYALSVVASQAAYLALWAFLGLGMRLCLYDAAFAALVHVVPSRGRIAISYLTLFGAFASSVFWVVGHYLEEAVGWRQTFAFFSVITLAVCLPLNLIGLSRREAPRQGTEKGDSAGEGGRYLQGSQRVMAIALFATVMSFNAFLFGVVSVQLVSLLEAAGLAAAAAVWVASLKGFAQFCGRVVEIVFGRNLHAMSVARIAIVVLPLAFALLVLADGNHSLIVTFTLLMGAAQGVISIVRGAVPLSLFGPKGYGAVLGLIATPVLIVSAVAPTIFALIVDRWGWAVGQVTLLVAASASFVAMEIMAYWYRRQQ